MFDRTSTGTSSKFSAASIKSTMKSLLRRFSRKSSTSQTSRVLAGTSEPITPTDSSRLYSPYPSSPPFTGRSSAIRSGRNPTQSTSTYNTFSNSSRASTPIRGSESLGSVSTSSTFESGSPLLSRSTGYQGTGLVIRSPTDDSWARSPTSSLPSPLDLIHGTLASPPAISWLPASLMSADTGYAASDLLSMKSPLLQSSAWPGLSQPPSPATVAYSYDKRSNTSVKSLFPSPMSPDAWPASFQTDIIHTEQSDKKSPFYANRAESSVFGWNSPLYTGPDRQERRDTPPISPPISHSFLA